jgi:putative glycosyltransferase (TIGR04372 family)
MKFKYIIKYFIKSIFIITFSPIVFIIHISGYRYINVFTKRIGHLALEPDIHIKKQILGKINKKKWIIFYKKNKVANLFLLNKWKKYFITIDSSLLEYFFKLATFDGFGAIDIRKYINLGENKQEAYEIYSLWKNKKSLITLTTNEKKDGYQILKKMGYRNQNFIVCIHNREKGYSLCDDELQDYRNSSINNFIKSIEYLCKQNIFTIRIGDMSHTKLKYKNTNFFDYSQSKYKSDFMDIYLAYKSNFLIGNTSGIACIYSVMGTPCGITNAIPLSTMWLSYKDLVIPKFLQIDKNYLNFNYILKKNISYKDSQRYNDRKIKIRENHSNDILLLTKEMCQINLIKSKYILSKNQKDFKKNIEKKHYCHMTEANISKLFIKKYENLFF